MQAIISVRKRVRFSALALALLSLFFFLVPASPVHAASYVVNTLADNTTNDAFCTLREAISAANNAAVNANCGASSTADDTITFSVSGTITLGGLLPTIGTEFGWGTLTIDATGQNVTISGNDQYRIFTVGASGPPGYGNLTIRNLTLTNGRTDPTHDYRCNYVNQDGGAICVGNGVGAQFSTLKVFNSTFINNYAQDSGSAIFASQGAFVTIVNSTFTNNSVDVFYGTVTNDNSAFYLANNTFSGNINNSGSLSNGVDYWSNSTTVMYNNIMANSNSNRPNCIHSIAGSLTTANNLIEFLNVNANCVSSNTNGNQVLVDPNLGALTGTPAPAYFPLNTGSLAIDTGEPATCADSARVNNQSQNGTTRPRDGDGNGTAICDIGSYEKPVTTATAVTCVPNPSTVGQTVTCTATITESDPATPGGTMTFKDGATDICTNVAVTGSTVQCTTSALAAGSHSITAAYGGNANFAASTSPVFAQTVNAPAAPAVVPTAAPKEVPEGDTLLLLGGGMSGLGVWLRYQWSKRKKVAR